MSTDFDFDELDDVKSSGGVLDKIEDLVENSPELTRDQKGPLRWAVRKAREKAGAAAPRATSRFNRGDFDDLNDPVDKAVNEPDPFAEDVPF